MPRSTPSGTPKFPTKPASSTISWTIPKPTDVLSYVYLWAHEAEAGREEGVKERPVVVVVATRKQQHGTELLVVPVTTKAPPAGTAALEMPPRVRDHLGLGGDRCWIVCDELNRFTWPGPDIRPAQRKSEINPFYGKIPGKLFEQVRTRLDAAAKRGRLTITKRTE